MIAFVGAASASSPLRPVGAVLLDGGHQPRSWFRIEIGDQDRQHGAEHHHRRSSRTDRDWFLRKAMSYMNTDGRSEETPGPPLVSATTRSNERDDGQRQENDHRQEHRRQHRDDDEDVDRHVGIPSMAAAFQMSSSMPRSRPETAPSRGRSPARRRRSPAPRSPCRDWSAIEAEAGEAEWWTITLDAERRVQEHARRCR